MIYHDFEWFKQRIGRRIYRLTKTDCCKVCDRVYREGLIVGGESHEVSPMRTT
jgi:hypothetical protein